MGGNRCNTAMQSAAVFDASTSSAANFQAFSDHRVKLAISDTCLDR